MQKALLAVKSTEQWSLKYYFLALPALAFLASAGAALVSAFSAAFSFFFWACLSYLLLRASLTLDLRASAWSANILDLAFSAFFLWICSMRTRLFLKVLPLAFRYSSWYKWRSIFLASLYLLSSLLRTRILMIHIVFWEVLASLVPLPLPKPVCLPFLRASSFLRTRDLEWTATGFLMTRPSLMSLRMFWRELALAISLISLGSSQTLFLPHFMTPAARRFCSLSELIAAIDDFSLVEVNQAIKAWIV